MNSETVRKMDSLGVDYFRINLSHTPINEFEKIIKKIQGWTNKPVCPDTEGAQLRTGFLGNNVIECKENEIIELVDLNENISKSQIPLSLQNISNYLRLNDILKIDFNSVIVQIIKIKNNYLKARVISGGIIKSNKGISVDRNIKFPHFSEKDIEAFKIAKNMNLNTFFLSFCSYPSDARELREFFNYDIKIISKIENKSGLNNLKEICTESDAILIDRGDLSRDVPLEKIAYVQKYIINTANSADTPVYIATNLMESMIESSKPTRAEVSDIVNLIDQGADGLVLAAESAIGKYPIDCIRIMLEIINEAKKPNDIKLTESVFALPTYNMISPHGGNLVQQYLNQDMKDTTKGFPLLDIDQKQQSDVLQICTGVYSPINKFMGIEELNLVLEKNKLINGAVWTLPILLQINELQSRQFSSGDQGLMKTNNSDKPFALLIIEKIEKLKSINNIAKTWFGTDNLSHPGVFQFSNGGEYIISGKPYLFPDFSTLEPFSYTPKQTRDIFYEKGWHEIIGFHTRNICHKGHEYIQNAALKTNNADALFISPVTGFKKENDFTAKIILKCYHQLIKMGIYKPFGAFLCSFNTFSRYSGPREAVFTAICRKNFGCSSFIVGRDHTGVGNFYAPEQSMNYFDELDVGMKIIKFDPVSYSTSTREFSNDFIPQGEFNHIKEISGSIVRDHLINKKDIPEYLLRSEISTILKEEFNQMPDDVLVKE